MKKARIIIILTLTIICLLTLCSCNSKMESDDEYLGGNGYEGILDGNLHTNKATNVYGEPEFKPSDDAAVEMPPENIPIVENSFIKTEIENTSTFSADVDTASYTFLRKMINAGYDLTELQNIARANVIRTEEIINYFNYNYTEAAEGEMFGTNASIIRSPWNEETYLLTLGLKAKEIENKTANNLVFLIDVSGSMYSDDKLPLLKQAFSFLVDQLDENDTVSIVTYAGSDRVALEATPGNKKEIILNAINHLTAGGSTNGEAGIRRAYQIAEANFKPDGNNRIIIASDGDLNVGISSPKELESLVEEKRKSGVFLSVLGFGSGNFRDDNMSSIAQTGNGVYHYIDSEKEAERIFATSLLSTIYTVAKDVKFQLTFDKNFISEYRLIGYENRLLENEDFDDDTKDAGEVGSGHTLTVCYELKLCDTALNTTDEDSDTDNDALDEWIKLSIRYKEPDADVSELREFSIGEAELVDEANSDVKFISALIEFSMLIRNSEYKNPETTLESLAERLGALELDTEKLEALTLINKIIESGK